MKNEIGCANYGEFFNQFRALGDAYGNLPVGAIGSAYNRAFTNMPYVQNTRVQKVSAYPVDFSRTKIGEMLKTVGTNEIPLRQAAAALTWTAYPWRKIIKEYADIMTYHWYVAPKYADEKDVKRDEFWRDYKLANRLVETLDIKSTAHQAAQLAGVQGKVFYASRVSADKTHGKINYAFLQQLPIDRLKIIGFNNISKYTVSFDLMYFLQPGTDWRQFGDLFEPYMYDFKSIVTKAPGKAVYANMDKFRAMQTAMGEDAPKLFQQNGRWCYWVSLPVDRIWVQEIADGDTAVVSPFAGLMLSMADVSRYEDIQISLTQNPLISLLTGEIPYKDNQTSGEDCYKLSPTGREFFEALFYQTMSMTDTTGIGFYAAPLENMKLLSLAEAPNATKVAAEGYKYGIAKAGLSAILPTDSEVRASMANISFAIESQYAKQIYACTERMVNSLIESLNLRYEFKFVMFGSLSEDSEEKKQMTKSMETGVLPDLFRYNALYDRSLLDDMAMSRTVDASGVLDLRKPLITSYSAKNETGNLPPQGGRPTADPTAGTMTDGNEQDIDGGDNE